MMGLSTLRVLCLQSNSTVAPFRRELFLRYELAGGQLLRSWQLFSELQCSLQQRSLLPWGCFSSGHLRIGKDS